MAQPLPAGPQSDKRDAGTVAGHVGRGVVRVKNRPNLLDTGVDDVSAPPCVLEVTAALSSLRLTAPDGVFEDGVGPASDPATGP